MTASLHVSVLGAILAAAFAVPMAALLLWMLRLPRPVPQEVARAVRSVGAEVMISAVSVGHLCKDQTARQLCSHELRWGRTIRSIDPLGYFSSIITHPFPLALLAALLGAGGAAVALAALAVICRVTLLKCVERRFRLERQPYWLVPLRDLISFAIFVWSLFGTSVNWNGETYQVTSQGILVRRTAG